MSTPSRQRLVRDYRRLQKDPPQGVNGAPNPDNIMLWKAVIFGPEDTPWDGGTFKLKLEFSEEYPNKAPTVKFISKIFHPNVYPDGSICLDILQKQWSPIYDVCAILTSIQSLLTDPNPNSPANQEAAQLFSENKREYLQHVQECVELSWMEDAQERAKDADQATRPTGNSDRPDKDVPSLKRVSGSSPSQDQQELHVCEEPEKLCKRMRCEKA